MRGILCIVLNVVGLINKNPLHVQKLLCLRSHAKLSRYACFENLRNMCVYKTLFDFACSVESIQSPSDLRLFLRLREANGGTVQQVLQLDFFSIIDLALQMINIGFLLFKLIRDPFCYVYSLLIDWPIDGKTNFAHVIS